MHTRSHWLNGDFPICHKHKQVTSFTMRQKWLSTWNWNPQVNMTQCGKTVTVPWIFLWALHLIMIVKKKKNVMAELESGFMKFGCQAKREEPWAVRLVAVSFPQQQRQRAAELLWRPAPSSSSSGKNLSPPCDALPAQPFRHPWTPLTL